MAVPRAAWPLGTATPAESNTSWYAALRVPEKGRYQNIISTDLVLIIWIISMINTTVLIIIDFFWICFEFRDLRMVLIIELMINSKYQIGDHNSIPLI